MNLQVGFGASKARLYGKLVLGSLGAYIGDSSAACPFLRVLLQITNAAACSRTAKLNSVLPAAILLGSSSLQLVSLKASGVRIRV